MLYNKQSIANTLCINFSLILLHTLLFSFAVEWREKISEEPRRINKWKNSENVLSYFYSKRFPLFQVFLYVQF